MDRLIPPQFFWFQTLKYLIVRLAGISYPPLTLQRLHRDSTSSNNQPSLTEVDKLCYRIGRLSSYGCFHANSRRESVRQRHANGSMYFGLPNYESFESMVIKSGLKTAI